MKARHALPWLLLLTTLVPAGEPPKADPPKPDPPKPAPVADASGRFNVKAAGAIGDGTADDSGAIQSAIDAAGKAGGDVWFPPGVYRVARTLRVTNPTQLRPTRLAGCGRASALNFAESADYDPRGGALHLTDASWCIVEGLYLKGPASIPRGLHVDAENSTHDVTLRNVTVEGFTDGICIGTATANDVSEVDCFKVVAIGAAGAGFRLGDGRGGNVTNHRFYGCSTVLSSVGLLADGSAFAWFGGTVQGNREADFRYMQENIAPVVVEGVRSENSRRFWDAPNTEAAPCPVRLSDIYVASFTDPEGIAVVHGSASPLLLMNCTFQGGPRPVQLRLGFDPNHPLAAVAINVTTDSDSPIFNPGAHLQATCLGMHKAVGNDVVTPRGGIVSDGAVAGRRNGKVATLGDPAMGPYPYPDGSKVEVSPAGELVFTSKFGRQRVIAKP